MSAKRKPYKKIALTLSLCLILIWALLGTGASLAWFSDTSHEVKNIFNFAEFDLEVSHRLDNGTYEKIDGKTDIFNDKALYEPGYVQVVYLKIENKGTVPFDYKTAVGVTDYTTAVNYFGRTFNLQDYLKFGVVTADTEEELMQKISDSEKAKEKAVMPLNNYTTEVSSLNAGATQYMALIVRMPEEVDNIANYRGDTEPTVSLGIVVTASQQR